MNEAVAVAEERKIGRKGKEIKNKRKRERKNE